jgi:hypothetical protein
VSDHRHPTALVEVHWARRVQATIPQISGFNLQESQIIKICKEEGCAVSTLEPDARSELEIGHLTSRSTPWTDSRLHPRIASQLAGGNQYHVNL